MNGAAVALDYNVLFTRMSHLGLSAEQHESMFRDIREMECEALDQMNRES